MLISVITPSNSLNWIARAYTSLVSQRYQEWEWVIVRNGDLLNKGLPFSDSRVVCLDSDESGNVGQLKKQACEACKGEIIVEFDHDDELSFDCLESIEKAAISNKSASFFYSDSAVLDSKNNPIKWGEEYGWKYSEREFDGPLTAGKFLVPEHPDTLPQNVSRIWFAPNHVRAWRKSSYDRVGGHNKDYFVIDDLELMCKLFLIGDFCYIDKVLYLYRIHGANAYLTYQQSIEPLQWKVHDFFIEAMALKYWSSKGLKCIDLGGGINKPPGWTSCDISNGDITADLSGDWPFESDSVGVFRASDFIEHIKDPIHLMNEAWRCLTHGGLLLVEVPSTDGRGAFQAPDHVSFWNSNSFWYWTDSSFKKYISHIGAIARFQTVRIENYYPSEWHKFHNIVYTKAHLAAVKNEKRLHGLLKV